VEYNLLTKEALLLKKRYFTNIIICCVENMFCMYSNVVLMLILQGIQTSKDSPRQTLSSTSATVTSAKTLQELHKNSKQTCETNQTAPLAAGGTPTLKSALQNHQRTKNWLSARLVCTLWFSLFSLSVCKLVTCKNESYLLLHERGMPFIYSGRTSLQMMTRGDMWLTSHLTRGTIWGSKCTSVARLSYPCMK